MRVLQAPFMGDPAADAPTRRKIMLAGLGIGIALATPAPALAKVLIKSPKVLIKDPHIIKNPHIIKSSKPLAKKTSRELALLNLHTGERIKAEYVQNGQYVASALQAVAVIMRDHYNNKTHPIDPHLLDLAFALHRKVGSNAAFNIVCGYRSPETNAMMREESSGVAMHSLHIQGKAIDIRLPGTRLAAIRRGALALKMGGVGYYPGDDFVHIDTGAVRKWVG